MFYLCYLVTSVLLIKTYFSLANHYNVLDKPNHRSSHEEVTVRGGGIIIPIAVISLGFFNNLQYPLATLGLFLIAAISFFDDFKPLPNKFRFAIHLLSVTLLFFETGLIHNPIWMICLYYFLVIGTINAINFMDGINGITVAYSLVTILSLYFINEYIINYALPDWFIVSGIGLAVFGFFNFRKKAICFAGDVGSISMAYIIIFLVTLLIAKTGDLQYVGLLMIYGLDAISTIIFRLLRKENVFEAHRSHFYQFLTNEKKWSHLWVATLYALIQLSVNCLIIVYRIDFEAFLILALVSAILFLVLRFSVEGSKRLLSKSTPSVSL